MVRRPSLPRALVAILLVGSLFGVALAAPATASPRPVPVCSPCERGFAAAAQVHGHDVRIEHSTATMRVHRNGSATWTVENRLHDATAFENASLRQSVAREATRIHDATLRSTSVDGETVRMRYRTPNVATDAAGGVLRVDYFRDDPGAMIRSGLGADRLTVVAPEGMTVGRALPGADVSDDGRRMTVTSFDSGGDGPFVTFVPEDDPFAPLWSLVAVALPFVPIVGRNVLFFLVVPSAVFAGGLAALARVVDRLGVAPATTTPDRRALGVVGLGVLGLAHPLYAGAAVAGSTPPLLAGAVGTVALGTALSVSAIRDRLSSRRLAGLVGLAFAAAVVAGYVLRALPFGSLAIRDDANVVTLVLPMLPVYAVTFVGYTAAHTRLRRGLAVAVAALALVLVTTFSIASQGGTLYFLGVVLGVLGAVAAVVVGIPFFLLGYGLPGSSDRGGRRDAADAGTDTAD